MHTLATSQELDLKKNGTTADLHMNMDLLAGIKAFYESYKLLNIFKGTVKHFGKILDFLQNDRFKKSI